MAKVLADWLKDKYDLKGTKIVTKEPLYYVIKGEKKLVPEGAVWFLPHSRRNDDLIVNITPVITHAHCLELAMSYPDIVKFDTCVYEYKKWPFDNSDLWGYLIIRNVDGFVGDGEVHRNTLQPSMLSYACTMLTKRAEDRLILRTLGLYQQGFYSEVEFAGSEVETDFGNGFVSSNKVNSEEARDLLREKINILASEHSDLIPDLSVFASTAFNKKITNSRSLTIEELKKLHQALVNFISTNGEVETKDPTTIASE